MCWGLGQQPSCTCTIRVSDSAAAIAPAPARLETQAHPRPLSSLHTQPCFKKSWGEHKKLHKKAKGWLRGCVCVCERV